MFKKLILFFNEAINALYEDECVEYGKYSAKEQGSHNL